MAETLRSLTRRPPPPLQIVGRYFKVKERNTSFTQELRGGSVTFLTVRWRPGICQSRDTSGRAVGVQLARLFLEG